MGPSATICATPATGLLTSRVQVLDWLLPTIDFSSPPHLALHPTHLQFRSSAFSLLHLCIPFLTTTSGAYRPRNTETTVAAPLSRFTPWFQRSNLSATRLNTQITWLLQATAVHWTLQTRTRRHSARSTSFQQTLRPLQRLLSIVFAIVALLQSLFPQQYSCSFMR